MTTVLLVHGTGVRQPAYGAAYNEFSIRLSKIRPQLKARPCYWGGPAGSTLGAGGLSIPSGLSTRSAASGLDEKLEELDIAIALWSLLEIDPMIEINQYASQPGLAADDLSPSAETLPEIIQALCESTRNDKKLRSKLAELGISTQFEKALAKLESTVNAETARPSTNSDMNTLKTLFARSLTALILQIDSGSSESMISIDGTTRDYILDTLRASLNVESDRSPLSSAGNLTLRLALNMGLMKPVERRRTAISNAAAPLAGDVLHYLVRGERIRDFINTAIREAGEPVVLISHSLGGIACLELLSEAPNPVSLLVTVGSQAPLLYELDALPLIPFGEPLTPNVPEWINIFDRRDFLAYIAEGLFPNRVRDVEVSNRCAFPRSHSAYFRNDRFYKVLDEILPWT